MANIQHAKLGGLLPELLGGRLVNTSADPEFSEVIPFRVLTVCTMNICRSPALETLLDAELADLGFPVEVASAGTNAVVGAPRCTESLSGLTAPPALGQSRPLDEASIREADLILTAERMHAEVVLRTCRDARSRVFTARNAGRLAEWVTSNGPLDAVVARRDESDSPAVDAGEQFSQVPDLPDLLVARARWLVAEMDASRGLPGSPRGDDGMDPSDIPDPHVLGLELHPTSAAMCSASVASLRAALNAVSIS